MIQYIVNTLIIGKANLRKQLIPKINKQLESFKTSKYEIIETKRTPSTTLNKFKQTWLNKDKNKCKSHLMKFKKVRNSDYLKYLFVLHYLIENTKITQKRKKIIANSISE